MDMKLSEFDDVIQRERCNNKPIYVNRYLVRNLLKFAHDCDKDPQQLAEYFLKVGINSAKHYKKQEITFDIENL